MYHMVQCDYHYWYLKMKLLQWRHNEHDVDSITNLTNVYSTVYSGPDQRKKSKLRVTGLCEGNSPVTGVFPTQRASNAETVPFDDVIMIN